MKPLLIKSMFDTGPKQVQIVVDENKSLKEVLDEHEELLPRLEKQDPAQSSLFWSWESLNTNNQKYFISNYNFAAFENIEGISRPIHLIDRLKYTNPPEVIITYNVSGYDDTIPFFLFEKYEKDVRAPHWQIRNFDAKEGVLRFIEGILSDTESHLVIEKFSRSRAERRSGRLFRQSIPSMLWSELTKDHLDYYRKFILEYADQVLSLNYCIEHMNHEHRNIFADISRGWINDFLYRIQNLMLVLFNIPEIFSRSLCPTAHTYSGALISIGLEKLPEKDEDYYKNHIVNNSISEIYGDIFQSLHIKDYEDYIEYCRNANFSDIHLRTIVHTFRMLFNKLKHSTYIQIIKSRDEEGIKRKEIQDIKLEIKKLSSIIGINKETKEAEMRRLNIRKEIAEKVRYAYGHLNFDDPLFKHNNGISITDKDNRIFRISLYDLEVSLKILVGVLSALHRAMPTTNSAVIS